VAPELVARYGRGRRMFNAYGPTEATVNSTLGESHPDRLRGPVVPIGVADPMTDVHVLDGAPATYHVLPDDVRGTCGEAYCAACADLPTDALVPRLRAIDGHLEGGPDASELERWLR